MSRYVYLGDRWTAPALRGAPCDPVRRPDGRCVVGGGKALVRFEDGTVHVVLRRRLRVIETQPLTVRTGVRMMVVMEANTNTEASTGSKAIDVRAVYEQLGGNRAMAMIGGRVLYSTGSDSVTVQFKAPGRDGIRMFVVRLADDDTYTVEFWKGRGTRTRKLDEQDMVYADSLRATIERRTGLYLSLGTMGAR